MATELPAVPPRPALMAPLLGPAAFEVDNTDLTRAVHHEARANRPHNTVLAYSNKHKEFMGYCDAMCPHQPTSLRYLVTPTKVYNFIFYQSHREKRKPGKPRRGEPRDGEFSKSDYESVILRYTTTPSEGSLVPTPSNPVQFQQINTYKSALIELHDEQVAEKRNNYIWTHDIWTCHCKNLFQYVKSRRNITKKLNYEEKVDETFSFFKAQGKATQLENAMWKLASKRGMRLAYPAIRYVCLSDDSWFFNKFH